MTIINPLTVIGNGLAANDGTGDTLRTGAAAINANSAAIVTAINNLAASQSAGAVSYLTKADMDADLAHPDGTIAWVTNDAAPANNQTWRKSGASGAGSWQITMDRLASVLGNGSGFQQNASGAVVRTFQDKGRDTQSILDFGAVADGVTDISGAITKAVAAGVKRLRLPAGNYKLSAPVEIGSLWVDGDGDSTVIDTTAITTNYVFTATGATAALPALGSSAQIGDFALTFASAPAVSPGDVLIIFNPTASSWSASRTYYNAGEYVEVLGVTGNVVALKGPLYDSYAASAVNVSKLLPVSPRVRNLSLVGSTAINQLTVLYGRNALVENVSVTNVGAHAIYFNRCFRATARDCRVVNTGSGTGSDYGIIFGNSQHGRLVGGDIFANRHAVVFGGSGGDKSVPVRDCRAGGGAILRNNSATALGPGNMHGNAEDCSYDDCTVYGPVCLAGRNVAVRGATLHGNINGTCVYAAECNKGTFSIEGVTMLVGAVPNNDFGVVNFYSQGPAFNASTGADCTVRIVNCRVVMRNVPSSSSGYFAYVGNSGSAYKLNVQIDGITFDADNLNNVLTMTWASGATTSDGIIVDNIKGTTGASPNPKLVNHGGAGTPYLSAPHRLVRQYGSVAVTTTASPYCVSTQQKYRWSYPRVPNAHVTVSGVNGAAMSVIGTKIGVPSCYACSQTTVTPGVFTSDNTNFAAGNNVQLNWSVGLMEC